MADIEKRRKPVARQTRRVEIPLVGPTQALDRCRGGQQCEYLMAGGKCGKTKKKEFADGRFPGVGRQKIMVDHVDVVWVLHCPVGRKL